MQLKSKLLTVGIVAVVTVFIAVCLFHIFPQSNHSKLSTDVVLEQLASLKSGNVDAAYLLAAHDFKEVTSYRDFERFIDRNDIFKNQTAAKVILENSDKNAGAVKVELMRNDQHVATVAFDMVKENKAWKILYMTIIPAVDSEDRDSLATAALKGPPVLTNIFDNPKNRYKIKYPNKWAYERLDSGTIILSGIQGSRAYYSSVNIQTVLTKKSGGQFKTVQHLVDDIKKQVMRMADDPVFVESGPYSMTEKNGAKADGQYLIFKYTYNGHAYQQWDVIVSRNDGQVFYVWAYTAPVRQYETDLPFAEAILASWQIY